MALGHFSKIYNGILAAGLIPNGVKVLFGEEFLVSKEDPPPRVIFVPPTDEQLGPPEGYAGNGQNSPRTIHTRLSLWEIHIWGWAGFTPVSLVGTSTGSIVTSGTPTDIHTVSIRIDVAGQAGVAEWSYSLDGGVTYVSAGALSSLADLGGTGMTVTLTDGDTDPSFLADDVFSFSTPGQPLDQYDAAETLMQQVFQAIRAAMWDGYFYVARRVIWNRAAEVTKYGRSGRMLIEFHVPVTMPADAEATISTFPMTTARVDQKSGVIETSV